MYCQSGRLEWRKTEAAVVAACGTPTVTICAKSSVLITIPGYGSTVGVAGVFSSSMITPFGVLRQHIRVCLRVFCHRSWFVIKHCQRDSQYKRNGFSGLVEKHNEGLPLALWHYMTVGVLRREGSMAVACTQFTLYFFQGDIESVPIVLWGDMRMRHWLRYEFMHSSSGSICHGKCKYAYTSIRLYVILDNQSQVVLRFCCCSDLAILTKNIRLTVLIF